MKFLILTKYGSYFIEADDFESAAAEIEGQEGDGLMGIILAEEVE